MIFFIQSPPKDWCTGSSFLTLFARTDLSQLNEGLIYIGFF
jgi:hypothetical protein